MTFREWVRKMIRALLPWPARSDRKSAVNEAKAERERSERARAHAQKLEAQLHRMIEDNHFAQRIAESLMRGSE
jgi:hypothetical protein